MICTATFIGNLTKDPETTKTTKNGEELSITKFSLAVNHGFGKDAEVSFFDFVAFNGLGTAIAQYRKQGDQIAVVAEPRQSRWTTQEGDKRNRIEFRAKTIEYLRSKGDGAGRIPEVAEEPVAAAPAETPAAAPAEPVAPAQESLEVPF